MISVSKRSKWKKIGGVQFYCERTPGNCFKFLAAINSNRDANIANGLAEIGGMLIEGAPYPGCVFVAECTGDTFTHILPLKLDDFIKSVEEGTL